ncbi:MAG: hypothetical protein HKO62_11560, partial [Gammaproteobacteria bacterium]|nr:hypothetical protein [Gammaproteobacteria bacterium]
GERNSAAARAVQKFQYQGASRTLTIDGLFEGTLTPDEARFFGEMVVWNESGLGSSESELASFFDDGGLGGIIFEGLFPEDTASTSLTNGGPFSIPLSISIDLADGDIFWFYASFFMRADGVGSGTAKADGFGTATFSFDDGTGISILGVTGTPVPVPAAAWLLLSGLGALICRQRAVAARA